MVTSSCTSSCRWTIRRDRSEWPATSTSGTGRQTLFEERADVVEAVVTVAGGRQYQFRYRGANGTWFNDDRADDYVPNEFGGVNCLIDLTTGRRVVTSAIDDD